MARKMAENSFEFFAPPKKRGGEANKIYVKK